MSMNFDLEKNLIWDNNLNKLVSRYKVELNIIGNKGNVFYQSKTPIFIEKLSEYQEAKEVLLKSFHRELDISGGNHN